MGIRPVGPYVRTFSAGILIGCELSDERFGNTLAYCLFLTSVRSLVQEQTVPRNTQAVLLSLLLRMTLPFEMRSCHGEKVMIRLFGWSSLSGNPNWGTRIGKRTLETLNRLAVTPAFLGKADSWTDRDLGRIRRGCS